jgi:hypothetical protein
MGSNDTEIVSSCSRLRARPDRVGFEIYGYKAMEVTKVIKLEAKGKRLSEAMNINKPKLR